MFFPSLPKVKFPEMSQLIYCPYKVLKLDVSEKWLCDTAHTVNLQSESAKVPLCKRRGDSKEHRDTLL